MSESNALNALLKPGACQRCRSAVRSVQSAGRHQRRAIRRRRQEFRTRGLQAQQALGQIVQQATDENGNVDWQAAHRAAAAAGPGVAMGMAKFTEDAANRRGQQIAQTGAMNGLMAMHGMSLMKDLQMPMWRLF